MVGLRQILDDRLMFYILLLRSYEFVRLESFLFGSTSSSTSHDLMFKMHLVEVPAMIVIAINYNKATIDIMCRLSRPWGWHSPERGPLAVPRTSCSVIRHLSPPTFRSPVPVSATWLRHEHQRKAVTSATAALSLSPRKQDGFDHVIFCCLWVENDASVMRALPGCTVHLID